jgi:hypothetical protein
MTVASIPASEIVSVLPNVIGAGGNGLDLSGLFLTNSNRVPVGSVLSFASVAAVASFFGPLSEEATLATIYFGGFDGATATPGAILFAQYNAAAVAAYIRGGSLASMSLNALKALGSGTLILTIDGTPVTSASIALGSATSFSNAATLITAGIATTGVVCTFDSVSSSFVITGASVGAGGSMGYATGTLAVGLKMTAATGALLSQGAIAATPATAMAAIVAQTIDFASFATVFLPVDADMIAFAQWNAAQNDRFTYVMWDTDAALASVSDTSSSTFIIREDGYSGTFPVYDPIDGPGKAAFTMGLIAAIDFNAVNGRTNAAFRSQSGLQPGVSNQVIAENLIANGANFYGRYATANDQFTFLYPGQITGPFLWLDSYINQIWMNNGFQLALMNLLTAMKSIPYNRAGYSLIETAMLDQVNKAVAFGAIRAGVTLTALQAQEADSAAGIKISDTLAQRGWYILVQNASSQVRAARGSPPVFFWYTDGQSVQRIVLNSIQIQ